MTNADTDPTYPSRLSWEDLYSAKFAFIRPFRIHLADNQVFFGEHVIRLSPKKRLIAFGTWQGKSVVAKLFFNPKHAKRHAEKDVAGTQALQQKQIATPQLFFQGVCEDGQIHVLLYERIHHAITPEQLWINKKSIEHALPLLNTLVSELAIQHASGLMQRDLHLNNYLITERTIYTLDGAEIEFLPHELPKKTSLSNLALFFSQLGLEIEGHIDILFQHYANTRGWLLNKDDLAELKQLITDWNKQRWKRLERKILTESSDFFCLRNFRSLGMIDRSYITPEFINFINDPDKVFDLPTTQILNSGRTTVVAKIVLGHRELVVKRFNLTNWRQRIRLCLRMTPAFLSWRIGQKLHLFGIPIAKPVAFLEKKQFGINTKSYYISEYIQGEQADKFFIRTNDYEDETNSIIKGIHQLLKNMAKLKITCSDLKARNIILDVHKRPKLVNVETAIEHKLKTNLDKAWHKQVTSLIETVHNESIAYSLLQKECNLNLLD